MRGVMFVAQGKAEVIEEPKPECAPDTMLLKTIYSGVSNGTERKFLVGGNYGDGMPWPKRIAYQHVSEVIECGEDVEHFQVGDMVYTGMFPGHVEYHLVRESDLIAKLPGGFDLLAGAMLGVASVAYHDARRARVGPGDNVLVMGAGLIGQLAAQAARVMGADHVTVAEPQADRRALAEELGTDLVLDPTTAAGDAAMAAQGPYSVILECSGADVLDRIIGTPSHPGLIGRRSHARLVLVAGRYDVCYNFNMAGQAEVNILHTQHFDQEDLDRVVPLVADGEIKIRPLIQDVVPLAEAPRIYSMLRDRPGDMLGVVFTFR